ncbi:MAG: IS4 family transposase [Bdellovibrionia bacterium]
MTSWVREELSEVRFGDQRLDERLLKVGEKLLEKPSLSLNRGQGDWAASKAAYRFFENDKVEVEPLLQVHVSRTRDRINESGRTILAIQDTTTFDYSNFESTEGLSEIYRNERTWEGSEGGQGLLVHSTFAVTTDGLPLGLLDQNIFTHSKKAEKRDHKNIPIENKESYRWITPIMKTAMLFSDPKNIVHVCDREGDIFELFYYAEKKNVKYLIRAAKDRVVGHRFKGWSTIKNKNKTLWELMEEQATAGNLVVEIPKQKNREAREALCEVRFLKTVYTPSYRTSGARSEPLSQVEVFAIWIIERSLPPGIKALEWMLLTNLPVESLEQAIEKVFWYRQRWRIEDYHKVLKSGCNIEKKRLNHIEKLRPLITLMSIVAFRIYWMTWVARVSPTEDCRVVLSESEWKALYCFRNRTKILPEKIPDLQEAIRWIAMLGGFLGRKGDGKPGATTLWRGWQRLREITEAWEVFNECAATNG